MPKLVNWWNRSELDRYRISWFSDGTGRFSTEPVISGSEGQFGPVLPPNRSDKLVFHNWFGSDNIDLNRGCRFL